MRVNDHAAGHVRVQVALRQILRILLVVAALAAGEELNLAKRFEASVEGAAKLLELMDKEDALLKQMLACAEQVRIVVAAGGGGDGGRPSTNSLARCGGSGNGTC